MSENERYFIRKKNEKERKRVDTYNMAISFNKSGKKKPISPIELEEKKIWDDESCEVVLTELFYQTMEHNELLQSYTNIMRRKQNQRANIAAARFNADPEYIIRSEEFTKFSAGSSESFLYRALNTLRSNGFVEKVARVIATKNTYYALTQKGTQRVIARFSNKYLSASPLFLTLINLHNKDSRVSSIKRSIDQFLIYTPFLLMKWLPNLTSISPLILCLDYNENETQFNTIYDNYVEYLVMIENYKISEIKSSEPLKKRILGEIYQGIGELMKMRLIITNATQSVFGLTERGEREFKSLLNYFQQQITELYADHMINIKYSTEDNKILDSSISLTNSGNIIGDSIREILSVDENLIIKTNTPNEVLPLHDEMERLQKKMNKAPPLQIRIDESQYLSLKDRIKKILSHHVTLTASITTSIISLIYATMTEFADMRITILGLGFLFLTLILYKFR